jgi:hypothetical protein
LLAQGNALGWNISPVEAEEDLFTASENSKILISWWYRRLLNSRKIAGDDRQARSMFHVNTQCHRRAGKPGS